jgi:HEAT repeat protein
LCARPLPAGDAAEAGLRRDAAHYLGFVGDAGAVAELLAASSDPRVRGSAYVAIGRIAARTHDPAAASTLRARLAVEDRLDAQADLAFAISLAEGRVTTR